MKIISIIIQILLFPIKLLFLVLIWLYKLLISPLLPNVCIFTPSCSTYALISIKRFGVVKGSVLSAKRILRCNWWNKGGFDPVPDNAKGVNKWVL